MATMANLGQLNQDPGIAHEFLMWVQGPKLLSLLLSQVHYQGGESEVEMPGLRLVLQNGMPAPQVAV